MTRQESNFKILSILTLLVSKYPDLRFGQLLSACEIIRYGNYLVDGQREDILVIDPFYEESDTILDRILKSKICNEKI